MPTAQTYQSEFTGSQMDARLAAVATLSEALAAVEQAIRSKYTKPASGIPASDMDADVQAALAKALTAIQSLADYYTKDEVDAITTAIAASVNATSGVTAASLPTASASTVGKIYYIGPTNGEYARYVTSYDGSSYSWVSLGTTAIDMSDYVSQADFDYLEEKLTDIERDFTESEDDEIRFETDADGYVGKVKNDGAHFKEVFIGTEDTEKKVSDFLPDIPKDLQEAEGIIGNVERVEVVTDLGELVGYFDGDGLKVKDIKYLNGLPIATKIGAVVDASGKGDYTTIQAAINATQGGDTILVMPGTYEESVDCYMKVRHIVGLCRETCILTNGTGNYDTPPLKMNAGSIRNMTIIADNYDPTIEGDPASDDFDKTQRPAYGIHVEQAMPNPFQFIVDNCTVISKWSAAIGAGVRYNQTLIVRNSTLISEGVRVWSTYSSKWVYLGGLYFHNDTSVTGEDGAKAQIQNCWMGGVNAGLTIQSVANVQNGLVAEFIGCTVSSQNNGVGTNSIYTWGETPQAGYLAGGDISLAITSHGNNIATLNS